MKLNKAAIVLSLLFMCAGNTMALEIPVDQKIISIQSNPSSLEGVVKTSNPDSATDITYLPVDVFSHVQYLYKTGTTRFFSPDFANGLSETAFVMMSFRGNDYGEYVAKVCYQQEIPVNALLIVKKYGDYLVRPIDISENRISRRCMNVPVYSTVELGGVVPTDYDSEFMVIIDKDYQNFPFSSYIK